MSEYIKIILKYGDKEDTQGHIPEERFGVPGRIRIVFLLSSLGPGGVGGLFSEPNTNLNFYPVTS